jgi:hypothetical protein
MGLTYQTGEGVRPGDVITYAGSFGTVEFVISTPTGDAAMDWYLKENPCGGLMLVVESCGSVFLPDPHQDEDLYLVSRKP